MSVRGFLELLRLQARSRHYRNSKSYTLDKWRGVSFYVGRQKLVAPIGEIREVVDIPHVTPVFNTAVWVLGLTQLRGEIITLIDFQYFLWGKRSDKLQKVLLIDYDGSLVGLAVDRVLGVDHFAVDDFLPELAGLDDSMRCALKPVCVGAFQRDALINPLFMPSLLQQHERFNDFSIKKIEY